MPELTQERTIQAPAEKVFDAIVDLRAYNDWLTPSSSYPGTTEISSDPVALGTTYVESGPKGVRRGEVTEFDRPTRVTFHQPMSLKPGFLGSLDIDVRYALTPAGESTNLRRVVTLKSGWPAKLVQPLIVRQFRAEIERTLAAMKELLEDRS